MLKLIIEDDEGRKTVVPFVRDEITIGRQEGNTIRLTERNVSRRHARLLRQSSAVTVEDLGSYNGIRINGDRISGAVQVKDGDLIQIGDYDLAIQNEDAQASQDPTGRIDPPTVPLSQPVTKPLRAHAPEPSGNTSETLPALPVVERSSHDDTDVPEASAEDITSPAEEPAPAAQKTSSTAVIRTDAIGSNRPRELVDLDPSEAPRLVVMNTEFAGREFTCARTELRIGRTDENDFSLDHRSLSRTHCKVVRENNGEWRVIDMQSANGLLVNGEPYAQVTVRSGDVIELGHVKLKFLGPGETYKPETVAGAGSKAPVGGRSKAPLIVLAVAMIAAIGVVGFFTLRSEPAPQPPPVKPPPKKDPVVKADPTPTPGTDTPVKNDKPEGTDPEAIIAKAREAIAAEDLSAAQALLKPIENRPDAKLLLNAIDQERSFSEALNEAEAALNENKVAEAQKALKRAEGTTLLKNRLAALKATEKEKAALAIKPENPGDKAPPPEVKPTPTPTPEVKPAPVPAGPVMDEKARARYDEAMALIDGAKADKKPVPWEAALKRLDACISIQANAYECHFKRGAALSNLGRGEEAAAALEKFLKLAPPDHPSRPKVLKVLEDFKHPKSP